MVQIKHSENENSGLFEAWVTGDAGELVQAGEMTYRRTASERMLIDHTRTFSGFEGQGIARQMVMAAVAFARENNRKIVPVCSYARAVLTRTDEYKDILA